MIMYIVIVEEKNRFHYCAQPLKNMRRGRVFAYIIRVYSYTHYDNYKFIITIYALREFFATIVTPYRKRVFVRLNCATTK